MSAVFECSLSIDCCVDFGSVCNAPGILLNCQNILNKKKKKKKFYHVFFFFFKPVFIMNVFLLV